jgi:hypothetical protein
MVLATNPLRTPVSSWWFISCFKRRSINSRSRLTRPTLVNSHVLSSTLNFKFWWDYFRLTEAWELRKPSSGPHTNSCFSTLINSHSSLTFSKTYMKVFYKLWWLQGTTLRLQEFHESWWEILRVKRAKRLISIQI